MFNASVPYPLLLYSASPIKIPSEALLFIQLNSFNPVVPIILSVAKSTMLKSRFSVSLAIFSKYSFSFASVHIPLVTPI